MSDIRIIVFFFVFFRSAWGVRFAKYWQIFFAQCQTNTFQILIFYCCSQIDYKFILCSYSFQFMHSFSYHFMLSIKTSKHQIIIMFSIVHSLHKAIKHHKTWIYRGCSIEDEVRMPKRRTRKVRRWGSVPKKCDNK